MAGIFSPGDWDFAYSKFHNSFFCHHARMTYDSMFNSKKTCLLDHFCMVLCSNPLNHCSGCCTKNVAGSSLQFCVNLTRLVRFSFAYTMVKYYTEQWVDHVFGVAQLGVLATCVLLKGNLEKRTKQGLCSWQLVLCKCTF